MNGAEEQPLNGEDCVDSLRQTEVYLSTLFLIGDLLWPVKCSIFSFL